MSTGADSWIATDPIGDLAEAPATRFDGWVAIDPKPMIGDPAYDPWPLLEQIDDPFATADPARTLRTRCALLADELGVAEDRILQWSVARRVETALWPDRSRPIVAGPLGLTPPPSSGGLSRRPSTVTAAAGSAIRIQNRDSDMPSIPARAGGNRVPASR